MNADITSEADVDARKLGAAERIASNPRNTIGRRVAVAVRIAARSDVEGRPLWTCVIIENSYPLSSARATGFDRLLA